MDDPAKAVFGFRGRAGRVPYALAFVAAAGVGLCFPDEITPAGIRAGQGTTLIGLIPLFVVTVWAALAQTVKRFHDLGWSGWNVLWLEVLPMTAWAVGIEQTLTINLVATVVMVATVCFRFWLAIEPGQREPNRYGFPAGQGASAG